MPNLRSVFVICFVQIPPLETKVFSCKYLHEKFPLPPAFLRTLSADEIRIEAWDIQRTASMDTLAPKPSSTRVKKVTITIPPIALPDLERLLANVAAMCPQLECFELVQDSKFYVSINIFGIHFCLFKLN